MTQHVTVTPAAKGRHTNLLIAGLVAVGLMAVAGAAYYGAGFVTDANAAIAPAERGQTLAADAVVSDEEVRKGLAKLDSQREALPKETLLLGYIVEDLEVDADIKDLLVVRVLEVMKTSNYREKLDEACFLIAPRELVKGRFSRPGMMRCYSGETEAYQFPKIRGQVIRGNQVPALDEMDPEYGVNNKHVIVSLTEGSVRENRPGE